jgi:hypothetical protein
MKKIPNKLKDDDVQSHIDSANAIIKQWMPSGYVEKVKEKLPKGTVVLDATIHNLKLKKVSPLKHMPVFNVMVEVALENKAAHEKLKKQIA